MGIVNSNNSNNDDDDDDGDDEDEDSGIDTARENIRKQSWSYLFLRHQRTNTDLNPTLAPTSRVSMKPLRLRASHLPDHVRSGVVGPALEGPVPRVQGMCGAWSVRGGRSRVAVGPCPWGKIGVRS